MALPKPSFILLSMQSRAHLGSLCPCGGRADFPLIWPPLLFSCSSAVTAPLRLPAGSSGWVLGTNLPAQRRFAETHFESDEVLTNVRHCLPTSWRCPLVVHICPSLRALPRYPVLHLCKEELTEVLEDISPITCFLRIKKKSWQYSFKCQRSLKWTYLY